MCHVHQQLQLQVKKWDENMFGICEADYINVLSWAIFVFSFERDVCVIVMTSIKQWNAFLIFLYSITIV